MPTAKTKTIQVSCPKCGHTQPEPRGVYSTLCKKCQTHFRLDEPVTPKKDTRPNKLVVAQRQIRCFQCGTDLEVPAAAESTMCKRCSSHVDLRDYVITQTVSKNFRTYGRLVVEEKGYVLNTDSLVGDAVLKGRLIGKLTAKRTLEIHTTAQIKGSFSTERLIVPAGNHFRWPETLRLGGAEIAGELAANLQSTGTIVLKSTGRLFGNVQARNFVVENGAIFVGQVQVGPTELAAVEVEKPKPVSRPAATIEQVSESIERVKARPRATARKR